MDINTSSQKSQSASVKITLVVLILVAAAFVVAGFTLSKYGNFWKEKTLPPQKQSSLTPTATSIPKSAVSPSPQTNVKTFNGRVEAVIQENISVKNKQDEIKEFQTDEKTSYFSKSAEKEVKKIEGGKTDLVKLGDSVIVAYQLDKTNPEGRILATSILILSP